MSKQEIKFMLNREKIFRFTANDKRNYMEYGCYHIKLIFIFIESELNVVLLHLQIMKNLKRKKKLK